MLEFVPLNEETAPLAREVYLPWVERISYYFPISPEKFAQTLFSQPWVHPGKFEMSDEASAVAIDNGKPVGWVQAGYLSGIASIPKGQVDALVRGLVVKEGRKDVGEKLLERALKVLSSREVRAWRAFEHNSGYTFATGIGKAPHNMTDVMEVLSEKGFAPDDTNFVYVTEDLKARPAGKELTDVKPEILVRGWQEWPDGVEWDQFNFTEHGEKVGFATVVTLERLTNWPGEDTLFVKGIAVEDKHHRRGIGHLIMQTLWDYYRPQGIRRIILNTADNNFGAQKFYEAIGFDMPDLVSSLQTPTPNM